MNRPMVGTNGRVRRRINSSRLGMVVPDIGMNGVASMHLMSARDSVQKTSSQRSLNGLTEASVKRPMAACSLDRRRRTAR